MTEPIDQATKDLIEKEAEDLPIGTGSLASHYRKGYVGGATAWAKKLKQLETQSHDQVRIIEHLEEKLAKERELRKELVSIVEYYHGKQIQYTEMPYKNWNAIIKKAKEL